MQCSLKFNGGWATLSFMTLFLVDNGIMLQVSLDGPQDIHDRWRLTRRGRGSFSRIMTNLKRIRDYDELYYAERI